MKSGYSPTTIFRVSGLAHPISIEEVNGVLSTIRDPDSGKVPYEIISMQADNRSFIVAARIKAPRNVYSSIFIPAHVFKLNENLERHGSIIRKELENFFPAKSIVSLEDYLNGDEIWVEGRNRKGRSLTSSVSYFLSGVFNALGFPHWYAASKNDDRQEEETRRSKKRRRVSFKVSNDE